MCIAGELGAPCYMVPNSATQASRGGIILNVAGYSGKGEGRPRRYPPGSPMLQLTNVSTTLVLKMPHKGLSPHSLLFLRARAERVGG